MTDRTDDASRGSSETPHLDTDSGEHSGDTEVESPMPDAESWRAPDDPPQDDRPDGIVGWISWFRTVDSGPMLYVRDLVTSVAIVLIIGGTLFAISGVWPPMVAIESGSMEPNMHEGDLVLIVDNERFVPAGAVTNNDRSTGVVPADEAETRDRTKFSAHGDVIVFRPNGNAGQTPVIHRTMLWVEAGEDWYNRADPDAIGDAGDCTELDNCPAPHAGFITQGDNDLTNPRYDQVTGLSSPVRPDWIVGTAEIRIPYLGHVRLIFSMLAVEPPGMTAGSAEPSAGIGTTGSTPGERQTAGSHPMDTVTTTERAT